MIPLLMANPAKMIRSDGTRVVTPRHPSWKSEFYGLWYTLRTDPWIVLLFPMFFASNWFYTWREYLNNDMTTTTQLMIISCRIQRL